MKRRELLTSLAAASVVATATQPSWSDDMDTGADVVDYLFVQNAAKVSLKDGVLRMKGVSPDTLYFSDRPERIVGRVATAEFVEHWATGNDSFESDPPNAVLTVLHEPEPQDVVVVLRQPRLEGDDLVYDVEVLDGAKTASGEDSALFIDVIGRPLTPMSFAGLARRQRRRDYRRIYR